MWIKSIKYLIQLKKLFNYGDMKCIIYHGVFHVQLIIFSFQAASRLWYIHMKKLAYQAKYGQECSSAGSSTCNPRWKMAPQR